MRVERLAGALLEALLNAIEANDPVTGMHLRRTAARALVIADAAGLDAAQQAAVERVALFHDIGKIYGALFDIVHGTVEADGSDSAASCSRTRRAARTCSRRWPRSTRSCPPACWRTTSDGTAPAIRADFAAARIPIEARITGIADTFDAVAQTRRYRRGAGPRLRSMSSRAGRGTQFDPELVDLVLLPPVAHQLANVRLSKHMLHGRRRSHEHEEVPDISFRWRSESLGSTGIPAMGRVD